jgi:hypothetical protein
VDTSALTTGAQKNVAVVFKAYDFRTAGVGATRTASTITSGLLAGMGIASGTPIYLYGGTSPTWTTTNGAQSGNTLTLLNTGINTNNTSYIISNTPGSSSMTVDVVPYITGLQRNASLYNTNRSKYGRYPVAQGEAGIVVSGFNLLGSATQDASDWVKTYNGPGTTASPGTADAAAITVTAAPNRSSFTMTLGNAQHSGWLRIEVNGVEAINNTNTNSLAWNKIDDGSGIASTKWTDDLYLSVWNTSQWANGNAFAGSTNAQYPTFAVDNTGKLYGSWINYATAFVTYNSITGTTGAAGTATNIFDLYDPCEFTDISIDQANNNLVIGYIQNTYGGTGGFTNADSGSVNVWTSGVAAGAQLTQATGYPNPPGTATYYGFRTDGLWHNSMLWEYYGVKVVRSGTAVHMAWYDDSSKSVKYAYFVSTLANANEQPWINIDGGSDAADVASTGLVTQYTTGISRVASVGQSVSLDVDKNGYPVISYYDNVNHVLRVAYSNSKTPNALTNWHVQAVHPSGDPLDNYAGANSGDKNGNLSIKINHTTGNVYLLAYRPTKGQLIYQTAADRAGSDFTFSASSVMDSSGNVGPWSDMSINTTADSPTMAYQNINGQGTDDGVKIAYWDTTLPTPDWETVIAPANTFVDDGKLSIAYNNVGATVPWTVAVGFKSTAFQVMYLQPTN